MTGSRNNRTRATQACRSTLRYHSKSASALARVVAGLVLMLGAVVVSVLGPGADARAGSTDATVLLRNAESGDARAAYLLGMRYARPDDSSRDDVEAVRWLRLAAEQGLAEAQYNLGIMYAGGRGVARDPEQSANWYRLAAEQGLASAQYNLGAQYAVGDGVPRDERRAARWFEQAALQDIPEAAHNLGVLYDLGRGVKADVGVAMQWYERAAELGYHPAASRLAGLRAANPSLGAKPAAPPASVSTGAPPGKANQPESAVAATSSASPAVIASPAASVEPARVAQPSSGGSRSASAWLAGRNPAHYTLQVLSHTDEASVRRYLEENFDGGEVGYFAFELDGKTWYSVVYGDYASHSQAMAAAEALAGRLRGPKPWVRKIAIIQKAAIR